MIRINISFYEDLLWAIMECAHKIMNRQKKLKRGKIHPYKKHQTA